MPANVTRRSEQSGETFELVSLVAILTLLADATTEPDVVWLGLQLALLVLLLLGLTLIFVKASKPWYACWIPIHAELTLLQMVDKPK